MAVVTSPVPPLRVNVTQRAEGRQGKNADNMCEGFQTMTTIENMTIAISSFITFCSLVSIALSIA